MPRLDSQAAANEIASSVQIKYKNVQKPIVSLEEAIEKKQFFPSEVPDNIIGDVEGTVIHGWYSYLNININLRKRS